MLIDFRDFKSKSYCRKVNCLFIEKLCPSDIIDAELRNNRIIIFCKGAKYIVISNVLSGSLALLPHPVLSRVLTCHGLRGS